MLYQIYCCLKNWSTFALSSSLEESRPLCFANCSSSFKTSLNLTVSPVLVLVNKTDS
ncbi:hypothetical protein EHR05_16745 [Leptospira licerasiae]|nr:hypothetical protein EHR05_16745 [Leptospira licerasiae]